MRSTSLADDDNGRGVAPARMPLASIRESADAEIVACAIAASADILVTGDKALFEPGSIENLPIGSPRQVWRQLAGA